MEHNLMPTEDIPASGVASTFGVKRRSRWVPYLSMAMLAEVAFLLHLAPRDLAVIDHIERTKDVYVRQPRKERRIRAAMGHDPQLGTPVLTSAAPSLQPAVMKNNRNSPTTLLFIGPCAPCIAKDLQQWRALSEQHPQARLVIVSRDTRENIARFVTQEKFPVPVIDDSDGAIGKHFNAVWTPRVYHVGADGRLAWVQQEDAMEPEAIAAQLWQEQGGK